MLLTHSQRRSFRGSRPLMEISIAVGALLLPGLVRAQCPDGSPPPCAAQAPVRRAPPLDDRMWLVLPFENVAKGRDLDWLPDASVNLLYLDLSRWQDIRVLDDERVADLLRSARTPPGALGLADGLRLAKQVGAGKLVMGDVLGRGR